MGILPLKKRVNRDKCSFATKQHMFGVFAIEEPGSPVPALYATLECHNILGRRKKMGNMVSSLKLVSQVTLRGSSAACCIEKISLSPDQKAATKMIMQK